MFKDIKKHKGFTLIELLLVVAIISIFLVVGTTFLRSSRNFNNLKVAQREVASAVKAAQGYALSGRISSGGEAPCGYGVRFLNDTTYSIYYIPKHSSKSNCETQNQDASFLQCTGSNSCASSESFSLPREIELKSPTSSSAEIYFTVPHGNVYGSSGTEYAGQTWKIFSRNDDSERDIVISSRGSIRED